MKYKAGDKVRIKSIDWYNENKDELGNIGYFSSRMKQFCGQIVIVSKVTPPFYCMEDIDIFLWTDEMIEGLVEHIDCKKCGLTFMSTRCLLMDNCPHNKQKNIIEKIVEDENNHITENVVDTVRESNDRYRIVIDPRFDIEVDEGEYYAVRRKKEYPKTYEECLSVLGIYNGLPDVEIYNAKPSECKLFESLIRLKRCRDAYWKIAGEEMGLGKPWEPNWTSFEGYPAIYMYRYQITLSVAKDVHHCLVFPTEEMRDAFKENFDPDIEICKEFL